MDDKRIYILYVAVFVLIVLYIIQNNFIIGLLAFLAIVAAIVLEFKSSISSEGIKKTAVELLITMAVVVLVIWVLPSVLLQSQSPINVVASCSMLPSLHRGDIVLVHGITNMSAFLSHNHVPVVNVTLAQFSSMESNITKEFIEPFAYTDGNKGHVVLAQYINDSIKNYSIGLYSLPCINSLLGRGESQGLARCYVNSTVQEKSLVRYNYTVGNVTVGSQVLEIPEISSLTIANTTIIENYSNPVVIYKTVNGDSFYSDYEIIHRVYAAINADGQYYLLTKGDNNPVIDMQAGNYPASANDVVGYAIADIPYLGYPSLIIKGQLGTVEQCNQTILR